MSKAIIAGLPHSGKTSKLIELFLQSLGERPDERRVMIVPDASHRDYLRTVIMQRGGLQALRESEVVTLAEFLRSLAEQAELVNGQRMTSLEELLAFRRIIRGLNETGEADIPLTLAAARLVKHTVEALRNAGLLLKLLPGNETPKLPARGAVGLKAAVRHFEAMKSTRRYDGLLAQEMAVFALQNGRGTELLPELVLVDGFYDLHPLHEAAFVAIAHAASSFFITAPALPGSAQADEFARALRQFGLEELTLEKPATTAVRLLEAVAKVKADETAGVADRTAIQAEGIELRPLPIYLKEAQFIADRALALHRREGVPLDEFLVILRKADAGFVAALRHYFREAGLPLIDLTEVGGTARVAQFLASCFAFAASPSHESLQRLIHSSYPASLIPNHNLFAFLHREGIFLEAGTMKSFARQSGAEKFAALLERLAGIKAANGRDAEWMRNLLAALGRDFITSLETHLDGSARGMTELKAEQSALESIMEATASLTDEEFNADELPALLAEICLYAGGSSRELGAGGVYLVDALAARQWQKQVCFIPQCDRGHWPQRRDDLSGDEEALRAAPELAGVRLRSPEEHFTFEESLFLSAVTRSTKLTIVTYAKREVGGNDIAPSPFLSLLAPAIRKLGGSEPPAHERAFGNRRLLVRHCAGVLRHGEIAEITKEAAAGVLAMTDNSERARLFSRGGLEAEPVGQPVAVPEVLIPNSFSPSALTAYRKCPYLYFALNLVKPGDPPESMQDGVTPLVVGSAAHQALQEAFAGFPEKADISSIFRGKLAAYAAECAPADFPLELERNFRVWEYPLRRAYESAFERLVANRAVVLKIEEDLRADFADTEGRKCTLHGRIDRADKLPDGSLAVTDYKTSDWGSFSSSASEGGQAKCGVATAPHIYTLLAAAIALGGGEKPLFSYHLLKENLEVTLDSASEETSLEDVVQAVVQSMTLSITGINGRLFPRAPHSSCVDCDECEAYWLCRRDLFGEPLPNEVEERFPEPPFKLMKEKLE